MLDRLSTIMKVSKIGGRSINTARTHYSVLLFRVCGLGQALMTKCIKIETPKNAFPREGSLDHGCLEACICAWQIEDSIATRSPCYLQLQLSNSKATTEYGIPIAPTFEAGNT